MGVAGRAARALAALDFALMPHVAAAGARRKGGMPLRLGDREPRPTPDAEDPR